MKNTVRIFICFLMLSSFFIFSSVTKAEHLADKKMVTLLISISGVKQNQFSVIAEGIAKNFHDQFSRDYRIRTIYQADQADLYSALNDKNNTAVFWVSHSDSEQSEGATNVEGRIIDSKGIDVSRIFTKVHSNLKWLGVVGCKAQPIFNKYLKEQVYGSRDILSFDTGFNLFSIFSQRKERVSDSFRGLVIAASSKIVDAKSNAEFNFGNALKYLRKIDTVEVAGTAGSNQTDEIEIDILRAPEQTKIGPMNSVQILLKDRIVFVFPMSNEVQKARVKIPLDGKSRLEDLVFVVDSGLTADNNNQGPPHLGDFRIYSDRLNVKWTAVSLSGKTLGVNQHLYKINLR